MSQACITRGSRAHLALQALGEHGPLPPKELAAYPGLTRTKNRGDMHRIVCRLVEQGMAKRQQRTAGIGYQFAITEAGGSYLQRLGDAHHPTDHKRVTQP